MGNKPTVHAAAQGAAVVEKAMPQKHAQSLEAQLQYWRKEANWYEESFNLARRLVDYWQKMYQLSVEGCGVILHSGNPQPPLKKGTHEWYKQELQRLIDEERYEDAAELKRQQEVRHE